MDIKQIDSLIHQGESETLEFKKSTARLASAFETVCAFLNGQGGIVIIGATDSGKIVGQNVSDATRQEMASHIAKVEPSAQSQINVSYVALGKAKQVITIKVENGSHAPYTYDRRPFYRNQSTTSKMPQHRYEQLLVERGQLNHSWEDLVAADYDLEDLDHDEISRTIQDGIRVNRIPPDAVTDSIETALGRLELLEKGRLKNAAVVLFAKKLFPTYSQCILKMARFKGTNHLGDFLDNQQIYGNIFKLLTEADHFLRRHLPIASFFQADSFERIDEPALPVLAVFSANDTQGLR